MKISTKKLIIHTILGIVAALIFYNLNETSNPFIVKKVTSQIEIGIYICPFIGLIYWIFNRNLE